MAAVMLSVGVYPSPSGPQVEGQTLTIKVMAQNAVSQAYVDVTGLRLWVMQPLTTVPITFTNFTRISTGIYQLDIVSTLPGRWRFRAECDGPTPASREIGIVTSTSTVLSASPPNALLATPGGVVIYTPDGRTLTAETIDQLDDVTGDDVSDLYLVGTRDGVGGKVLADEVFARAGGLLRSENLADLLDPLVATEELKVRSNAVNAVLRSVAEKLGETLTVDDFRAPVDVDDTNAFVRVASHAASRPGSTIRMLERTYVLNSVTNAGIVTPGNTRWTGAGKNTTTLLWNDDEGISLFRGSSSGRIANVVFDNFGIVGTQDTRGNASSYPMLLNGIDDVTIQQVRIEKSRAMAMAIRTSTDVKVRQCDVRYCGRDGINAAQCTRIAITDNNVFWCDDDAIAAHTSTGQPESTSNLTIITNNRIFLSQGIKVLAARNAIIAGNVIDCPIAQGISVRTIAPNNGGSASEGMSAGAAVTIYGNKITNIIDRGQLDNLNSTAAGILINGYSARAGTEAAVPGTNDPNTGTIVKLYDYLGQNSSSTTVPTPGTYWCIISNNIIGRTLPGDVPFSSYGRGQIFVRGGWMDPTITRAGLSNDGIRISAGSLRNILVTGNQFFGLTSGFNIGSVDMLEDLFITNNLFWDINSYGILCSASTAARMRVYVTDNLFDMDPLHRHTNRGANGTWLAQGSPVVWSVGTSAGWVIARNTIRNTCRDCDINSANDGNNLNLQTSFFDNVAECDPVTVGGFSTSNKGIGLLRMPAGVTFRHLDSDPASPTYGRILTPDIRSSGVMPSNGKYVRGTYIRNNQAAPSGGKVLLGWCRLTTGTGHVADVDWQPVYATTS